MLSSEQVSANPRRNPNTKTRALLSLVVSLSFAAGCGRIAFDAIDAGPIDDRPDAAGSGSALSFARLCDFDSHVIIENGIALDDDVGRRLSDAVNAGCASNALARTASQDDASTVDATTGRPLTLPGELILLGGGDGPHRVVRYLLAMDTPLLWSGGPPTVTERVSNRVVAQGTTDSSNDFLLFQVVEEPVGGTVALSAQGFGSNGTGAAALYFEQVIGPAIHDDTSTWSVWQWSDSDLTPGPSQADSYTLIESD
jgi:hypothetical protein